MTRMTSDIEALSQLFQDGIVNLAVQGLTMVIVTVILFLLNPALAAITVLLVVPAMTIATIWYRSASDRGYAKVRERIAEVLADLQESLSGIRIISAHNRRRHNVQQHRNIVGEYQSANQYTARVSAVYGPLTDFIGAAGQAVVLLVGGNMVLNGSLTIGELTAFVLYLAAFFAPIQQLVQLYTTYQSGQAAVDKLQELLATHPSVPERADAIDLPPIAGHVVLDHVSFGYTKGKRCSATSASTSRRARRSRSWARPAPGSRPSRSSSLASTTRPRGRWRSTDTTCATSRSTSLRHQIGVVPQEAFLFAGSVRTTSPSPGLTHPTTKSTRRVARSASTSSSRDCPRGSTRWCTNGARRSRPGAPAARTRPRVPRPAAGARARRGNGQPRPAQRGSGRARARRAARGSHRDPHRAPARHRHARRSHRGGRRRSRRRAGIA